MSLSLNATRRERSTNREIDRAASPHPRPFSQREKGEQSKNRNGQHLSCPFSSYHVKSGCRYRSVPGHATTSLFKSIGDAAAREVVRRHLYADPIADQNAYAMLAHFAGNRCQHDVRTVVELDLEESVGLFVDYRALCWN